MPATSPGASKPYAASHPTKRSVRHGRRSLNASDSIGHLISGLNTFQQPPDYGRDPGVIVQQRAHVGEPAGCLATAHYM